jgi:hypothetical protein
MIRGDDIQHISMTVSWKIGKLCGTLWQSMIPSLVLGGKGRSVNVRVLDYYVKKTSKPNMKSSHFLVFKSSYGLDSRQAWTFHPLPVLAIGLVFQLPHWHGRAKNFVISRGGSLGAAPDFLRHGGKVSMRQNLWFARKFSLPRTIC